MQKGDEITIVEKLYDLAADSDITITLPRIKLPQKTEQQMLNSFQTLDVVQYYFSSSGEYRFATMNFLLTVWKVYSFGRREL